MAEHEISKGKKGDEMRRSKKARESAPQKVEACNETAELNYLYTSSVEDPVALLGDARLSHPANTRQKALVVSGLQRTHGNAYVQRLLESRAVQAKLSVNPPDDQHEREADRVAATITQTPEPRIQGQPESEEEDEKVQMKAFSKVPEVSQELETRINAARGSGQTLSESARASLEGHLHQDLSQVRIHTDAEADELSQELQARAFTRGQDIFFREGAYQPNSDSGKKLLGHEVTHVVQQGAAFIRQHSSEERSVPLVHGFEMLSRRKEPPPPKREPEEESPPDKSAVTKELEKQCWIVTSVAGDAFASPPEGLANISSKELPIETMWKPPRPIKLKVGDVIYGGSEIETGAKSRVALRSVAGSEFRLGAKSKLILPWEIVELPPAEWAIKPIKYIQEFEIRTGNAVAGVRG